MRERVIYGALLLGLVITGTTLFVRANTSDVGSLVSVPALRCESDLSWVNAPQAEGQPSVAYNGSRLDITTDNSAYIADGQGDLVCSGYSETDDLRVATALSLSLRAYEQAEEQNEALLENEQTITVNTAASRVQRIDGRSQPLQPNAVDDPNIDQLDTLFGIEISRDRGETWQLLHVVDSSIYTKQGAHMTVLLPEIYSQTLGTFAVRVVSMGADMTGSVLLVDAATITYEIGKKKEISLKAKDKSGNTIDETLPVLSPNTTARFELTAKDPNDGLVQGVGSKVGQIVSNDQPEVTVEATIENEGETIAANQPASATWKQSGLSNADSWDVEVDMPRSSEIGKYTVTLDIVDEDGATRSITQDFLWGVLALNPDKSVYTTGDTGTIAMTVLDELGKTICDANATLRISGPASGVFSTSNGSIAVGEECLDYGDHISPDYWVDFDFTGAGTYDLELTAITQNGTYTINEQVTAEDSPLFSVRRSGPTRIFPPVTYDMEFEITANQAFNGEIVEAVPSSFVVGKTGTDSYNTITTDGDTSYLHFPIQLLEGESVALRYQFTAPDISPEFYLLGPLEFIDDTNTTVFSETRQWQLAGDAVGRMILFFDGATIPSGWTCISCTGGDPFYQTFVRGAGTYGGTGGGTTHTHTASGDVVTTGSAAVGLAQSGTIAINNHAHTYSPTLTSPSNIPSYRQLKMIRYNTTGEPATLPTGAIGVFDATVPTGWTRYSAQDGAFIRGEGTAGTTGGSNTHTVAISGTTGTATGGDDNQKTGGTQVGVAPLTHDHSVSGTSAPSNNEPTYTEVILGKLDAADTPPNALISMWDDQPASGWNYFSDTGDALNGQFIKPAATYGTTGGADTHTHSDTAIASGAPSTTASTRSGTSSTSDAHTHTVNVTGYSSENHLPPYREVVFAKRDKVTNFEQSAFRFYENANSADVGSTLAAQDTAATAPSQGTPFRLRMAVHVSVVNMPVSDQNLKLQYALQSGACDTGFSGETYADVGTASGDIRYYDNSSPADGNALTTNANDPTHSADTMQAQTYEESNNFTNSQSAINTGQDGVWDFSLVDFSAPGSTAYCFRIVNSSGATLNSYSVVPQVTTAVPPPKMVLLFDGATIPSGWSCVSCNSGEEAYQRFIRGEATSTTGGSATHSHTGTGSVAVSTSRDGRNNDGAGIAEDDHAHTFTPTIAPASNLASYRQLKLIKYDSGTPGTIPSGAIALYDAAVPAGWTRYSAQDGTFVRGEGTAGTTGGSNTHANTISGTTGGSTGAEDTFNGSSTQEDVAPAGHTHTVNGTTSTVDIQPPYIETILGQANSDTTIPGSMIALWDQDPGGTWTCVSCTGADAFYQTFFKPAATYGTTGGAASHTHINANLTSGVPSSVTPTRTGTALASDTHTHGITVSAISNDNHLPPYIDYVFSKSASTNSAPNNPTTPLQEQIDTTNITVGSWTNESTVVFKANVTDPDNPDSLAICVEAEILGTAFDNVNTACGSAVAYSGSSVTASLTLPGLTDGAQYHWQVRTKDGLGAYSAWISFGANAEAARDFAVDSSGPTGTVYDGTTTGVDIDYNNGALDSLSANWDIDASVSGLVGYDYSIGTTPAASDVKAWTANGTTAFVTANSLTLNTSQPYYFNVRTTDNAGSQSIISSDGQFVSPTLTFSSSPTNVQFDGLNPGNSFTSTKSTTLTTSTNAYNGYEIRAFSTGLLTNINLVTIPDFAGGTYAAPDEWQGGDLGYGYTSNDNTIQGANIFNSIPCLGGGNPPCYAPFTQTAPGDIIADHTSTISGTAVVNENYIVTHRVTTGSDQEAGDYQTTIIFTITAIY